MLRSNYIFVFIFFSIIGESQNPIFVNSNAIGANNGTSWDNAFTNLQSAISATTPGNQIWVAKGTYKPTNGDDNSISFNLKNEVAIYGGFIGTETNFSARNISSNICILSGDIGKVDSLEDNSLHVVYAKGVDSSAILDGFWIVSGYAHSPSPYGGGLLITTDELDNQCSPTIRNCTFFSCDAVWGGAIAFVGEGIDNNFVSTATIKNCTFLKNFATYGGAIYKQGHNNVDYLFKIEKSTFQENRALLGGAINFANADPNTFLIDCKFEKDSAQEGAGLFFEIRAGSPTISFENTTFSDNYANSKAGAILIYSFDGGDINLKLSNLLFNENIARYNDGGAISIANKSAGTSISVFAKDCTFFKNKSYSPGAAMEMFFNAPNTKGFIDLENCCFIENARFVQNLAATISMRWASQPWQKNIEYKLVAKNCLFIRNKSVYGSLTPWESRVQADFVNCTFYNNGLYPFNKDWRPSLNGIDSFNFTRFTNCIIWESNQPKLEQIFYNNNPMDFSINDYKVNQSILSHLDCGYNNVNICAGNVQHSIWPDFIDTIGCTDFVFDQASSAFNAGLNGNIDSFNIIVDYSGNPRIFCDTVDLGAFEAQLGCTSLVFEPVEKNVVIFPNPAHDMVQLSWPLQPSSEAYLVIKNALQQSVFSSKTADSSINIDVKPFQSGIYYAFIIQEGKKVLSMPFIIVK